MPKDASPSDAGEVELPGGRRGRIVPADDAGQFVAVVATSWVDRLHSAGVIDADEADAAARLHELFELSSIRPRMTGAYDGMVVDGVGSGGLLETLSRSEMAAWRKCNRMLEAIPSHLRSQVRAVALWDTRPWRIAELRLGLQELAKALRQRDVRPCRT